MKKELRIFNLSKERLKNINLTRLGPIQNILNNSISPALIQTKNELNELIKLKGSKYPKDEISDQLDFFIE